VRCSTVLTTTAGKSDKSKRGSTKWAAADLPGFSCTQKDGESNHAFARRRALELEAFAEGSGAALCSFKAILKRKVVNGDAKWSFNVNDDGSNFKEHAGTCFAFAKPQGRVLQRMLRENITADPSLSRGGMEIALTGAAASLTAATVPSRSSLYRASGEIKHESDAWYTEDWARMETYITLPGATPGGRKPSPR
jgi:hypothetical protein